MTSDHSDDELGESSDGIEQFRTYLRFLARVQIGPEMQGKLDPSDIVQQSMLQAHRAWKGFRGQSEAELAGWLRTILANTIAHAARHLRTQKRDVGREQSIHEAVDASSMRLEHFLAAEQSSPSQRAVRREHAVLVAEAVESLSEDQREAIVLRYWHGMTLAEVAKAMDKTLPATAGLVHRGLKMLRQKLELTE